MGMPGVTPGAPVGTVLTPDAPTPGPSLIKSIVSQVGKDVIS